MSTIHTEASVAASEVEPSASGAYDYSESINDNDEKLDEGLRAPVPIHGDDLDTSLLSDNELEAFVKAQVNYPGKHAMIPPNLQQIFKRLSGLHEWNAELYQESQIQQQPEPREQKSNLNVSAPSIIGEYNADTVLNSEVSFSEDVHMHSPLATMTPATSAVDLKMGHSNESHFQRVTDKVESKQAEKLALLKNKKTATQAAHTAPECSMKEMMQHMAALTSEVIQLQQSLYVKDVVIKNLYLRLKDFDHISFPQLLIERIHIVANYNNKHKYSHKSNHIASNANGAIGLYQQQQQQQQQKQTLLEEESVSHDQYGGSYGGNRPYANSASSSIKQHSTVTLEVITRWISRYSLPSAVKKGLVFIKDGDIADVDDYLTHQMYNDWQEKLKTNKHWQAQHLAGVKREEVSKQLAHYMQHERVGLVRIEILRGKKYKKYKRIEKKFESLIIPIADVPKGDTYHIMIKVYNPSASLWGSLSNMISIKVPLKFVDDDDTDNDTNVEVKKNGGASGGSKKSTKTKK